MHGLRVRPANRQKQHAWRVSRFRQPFAVRDLGLDRRLDELVLRANKAHGEHTNRRSSRSRCQAPGRTRLERRNVDERGAIEPADALVQITTLLTREVTQPSVASDGSFEVRVNRAANIGFVVQAHKASQLSSAVYVHVAQGSAAIGDGKDGWLSCEQRSHTRSIGL